MSAGQVEQLRSLLVPPGRSRKVRQIVDYDLKPAPPSFSSGSGHGSSFARWRAQLLSRQVPADPGAVRPVEDGGGRVGLVCGERKRRRVEQPVLKGLAVPGPALRDRVYR